MTAQSFERQGLRLMAVAIAALLLAACQSSDRPKAEHPAAERRSATSPATPSAAPEFRPIAGAPRPNIIVILADDLGYADVSAYRAGRIPTPNIDSIGRDGVRFTQGYSSAPICSPARAGLLTGRHQQRFGFEYNPGAAARELAERRGLDTRERTMADALRAAGYRTAAIGKWHLGGSPEFYPTNRGFDEYWGFLTGQTNHIRPDAPEAVNAFEPVERPGAGELARAWRNVNQPNRVIRGANREPVELGDGLLTEQLTEQAVAFIDRNRERPFFLYLAHHAPHTPLQITRKYFDRFPNIANRTQRVYAGMVSALDDGVGAVLEALARNRIEQNTIVVFIGDNGCAMYVPDLCTGEPVSGGKLSYLEGGVRVPYLMRWPARIGPGKVHGAPVSSLDLFPTFAAAAGVGLLPDRAYDGIDLIGQLSAPNAGRAPLYWRSQPMAAVRDGQWKYVRELDGAENLYDLASDPRELRNLATAQPSVLAQLRQAHRQWESDKAAPLWQPNRTRFMFEGRTFEFTP